MICENNCYCHAFAILGNRIFPSHKCMVHMYSCVGPMPQQKTDASESFAQHKSSSLSMLISKHFLFLYSSFGTLFFLCATGVYIYTSFGIVKLLVGQESQRNRIEKCFKDFGTRCVSRAVQKWKVVGLKRELRVQGEWFRDARGMVQSKAWDVVWEKCVDNWTPDPFFVHERRA